MGYYGMYMDPTYILVIIGALLCLAAQAKVKTTFNKYQNVRSHSGMTGAMAAERMLLNAGIRDVQIVPVAGNLTDHYDPRNKTVNLSQSVYNSTSVAAVGVACHECGHAIQHARHYAPLAIRSALVPVANFGSQAGIPLIILGAVLGGMSAKAQLGYMLIQAGILFFCFAVLFQLVTLPVEFNASSRAMKMIVSTGILSEEESHYTRKVLTAAALTYVASAAASILQLLRLIMIFGGRRRD
ncbi:MAG: zinc metallopeptidase [Lachnospiraceae bacterium]|nr:zinc metallopeptidase [Lachnospiraceae bacterium]